MKQKVILIAKNPLFSGGMVMMGGSMVVNAVSYLYHVIIGRIMGPVDYGALVSLFSIIHLISIIPSSSSFAIVKFISSEKDKKERDAVYGVLKKFTFKLAVGGFFLLLLSSPWIAGFLHIENIVSIYLLAPILFLSLITLVNQSSMQGILRFSGVVLPNFSSSIGKLIFGLALVVMGFSVSGAILGVLLAQIIAYVLSEKMARRDFISKISGSFHMPEFMKYAFPVLLQALAFTSFFSVDVILAKHFLPAFDAGLYAALSMLGKIIFFASQPITGVMFPIVAGRRSRGEKYREVFFLSFVLTAVVSIAITFFYYLFPNIAIGMLYGTQYLGASKELVWMGIFVGIYSLSYILVNFLLSINRTKIVILPLLALFVQVIGIIYLHGSVLQIIQIGIESQFVMFLALVIYLLYNEYQRVYAKG